MNGKSLKTWKRLIACLLTLCMVMGAVQWPILTAQAAETANTAMGKTDVKIVNDKTGELLVNSGSPASKMTDGAKDNADFFAATPDNFDDFTFDKVPFVYYQVNLEKVYDISAVNLYRYWKDSRQYRDTIIVISEDEVFDAQDQVIFNASQATDSSLGACVDLYGTGTDGLYSETSEGKTFAAPAGTAGQYVRVYMRGSFKQDGGTHNGSHVVELEVLGTEHSDAAVYTVTLPEGAGYHVVPYENDPTSVEEGGSFRFQVLYDAEGGYSAPTAVKANGIPLTAEEGVYTIEQITQNQEITVEGVEKATYTVTFPADHTGYSIEIQDGGSTEVEENGSIFFKIILDEAYSQSRPVVKAGETVYEADENGVYGITNIRSAIEVTIEGVQKNPDTEKSRKMYLSDLDWKSATNAVGSGDTKDTPTKDANHGDGQMKLLVDGTEKTFAKGIGIQTDSVITYDLAGKGYTSFRTLAGVDHSMSAFIAAEVCDVIFKVYLDGEVVFNSEGTSVDPDDDAWDITIPLTEENKELKLEATHGVNTYSDWGNWSDAFFLAEYPDPVNLAFGKNVSVKVTATGEDSEVNAQRPGSMAVDEIINSVSNYCDFGADNSAASRYLQIDLGEIYELDRIQMWRYWTDSRIYNGTVIAASRTSDFKEPVVVYNSDANDVHRFGTGTDALYTESADGKEFAVPEGTEGRYIRVYMSGSNKGNTNHIVEVKVMGYDFHAGPDPYEADALENSPVYFDLVTNYDTGNHVSGQVTHPDITVMEKPWNGYKYWMVYTPNVMLTSQYEQPAIAASKDGVKWEDVASYNPIEAEPVSTRYHNNDADIVYDPVNNRMMAFWKWDDDQGGGAGAEIRVRMSYDGIHWGKPLDKDGKIATTEDTVVSLDDDPVTGAVTVIRSKNRYDMQSPAFTYDDYRGIFVMWANNSGDAGYNNGQNNFVEMRWSKDGMNWSERTPVNNFLGKNQAGQQLAPWHQDVQYIPEFQEYWALSQCFAGGSPDGSVLYLTKSKDGINWDPAGTKAILNAGKDGAWDDFQIYRSTFYYDTTGASDPKQGVLRVWYSALQKNTAGKMVIDSSGEKTIQATNADSRIWRIGYTENAYKEVMKALTQNEYYEIPEDVAGTGLKLALNKPSLTLGEEGEITAAFTPENTSDQVLKYTSRNPEIATVDALGKVTGTGDGITVIEAENRSGLKAEITVTVGELQRGEIRHKVDHEHPLYLENYYWSDDAPSKDGLSASKNYDDENRADSPVMLYHAVPDTLKENTVILLIAERSLNNTDAIKEWIKRNVELCNENKVPCAVQIANGETNVNNTIPLSFWNELAEENEYLVGFNAAEMYNRFNGDNRDYVIDMIRLGIPHGISMMWTDTNIFDENGVIYKWLTQDDKLSDLMRENKEYITLMTKESYGSRAANTDALFKGLWLTDYCANWGIASDWWHWQLDGNGGLFDQAGEDAWKQCLSWPENMYTQDVALAASQGATCFKSEAQWYSNATKGMRTPTYQYSMIPFLEKLVSGAVKIPTKAEVMERTKAIVVGAENWNSFNYDFSYSNLYPKTGQYGIVPFVPSNCPEKSLEPFDRLITENYGAAGLKNILDTVYPVPKSEGTAYMENFGDTWYWMNSSEDKDVHQYTEFTTVINGSDRVRIEGEPHVFGIIKENPESLNVYLSNYRLDKSELWDGTSYPGGFSDQGCYSYVWTMCERMLAGTGKDTGTRDTVITVKNAVEPKIRFVTESPADRTYGESNYIRPYTSKVEKKAGTEDEWVITISHNGVVELNIETGDKNVEATDVKLSEERVDVIRNRTASATAEVLPANAGNKQLTWSVKDESIASVDNKGNVTGIKEGKTTLRAAVSASVYAECEVQVIDLAVTEVRVDEKALTMDAGDTAAVSVEVLPSDNSDSSITWLSSNEKVATVSANGTITAHEAGVAHVIAQSAYAAKGIVTVTVNYTPSVRLDRTDMTAEASDVHADSGSEGPAANVLDGDKGTIWHTNWTASESPKPHWIEIDLDGVREMNRFVYTPRTGAGNGTFLKYILSYTDADGEEHALANGTWERNAADKVVDFEAVEAAKIKLTAGGNDETATVGAFGSAAEINLYAPAAAPTSAEIAANIKEIAPIEEADTKVTLPEFRGYQVSIKASGNPDVIDADGNIFRSDEDVTVALTLTVENGDQDQAETTVSILVPARKETVLPEKVELNKTAAQLKAGETLMLTAVVTPENATDRTITWSTENPKVAEVVNGKVTAKAAGETKITASTVNGKTACCTITVIKDEKPVEPTGVTLDKTNVALEIGGKVNLTAVVAPVNAPNKTVSWKSDRTDIVSVIQGVVTANHAGTARITASSVNGKTAVCVVNVRARDLSKGKIDSVKAQKASGKAIKPAVSVTYGNVSLKKDQDYTVAYKNNVKPGTASMTFTGKGDYSGVLKASFVITAAKGKVYTAGKARYKVTNATAGKGTVTFVQPLNKNYKNVTIPASVKIGKYKYRVTAIGAKAFYKNKSLKKITVKSTSVKSVGKNAFKGTNNKLVIKVPKSRLNKYTKYMKGKGESKLARITK